MKRQTLKSSGGTSTIPQLATRTQKKVVSYDKNTQTLLR